MEAYGKNILIECDAVEETTASGIIVQKEGQEAIPNKGIIVSQGDQVSEKLGQGTKVLFRKYAGGKGFKLDGKTYTIVHEDDILLYGQV